VTQNIYDDPEFFDGYSRLRRSVEGLDGAPEWPAMRAMLPDMAGLKVIDLGCGFGAFCRWAHRQGAGQVIGLDVSENMLERAWAEAATGISYALADIEDLRMPEAEFDLVYSALVFHYIEDVASLYRLIHRTLVPGGRLVFSIEHPIYMAPSAPGWGQDAAGDRAWPVNRYAVEGERTTDWLTTGVVKYHRTLATTLNLLIQVGFTIDRVEEFAPTDQQVAEHPALAEERDRPMFLLISARR